MKRVIQLITFLLFVEFAAAQQISKKLDLAVKSLESDSQMKSAIIGFYVTGEKGGRVVFDKNSKIGFAMASSQKVLTSAAALELLGTDYRYKTTLSYSGKIENGILSGNLYLTGSADPTLGSWRYDSTKEQVILNKWIKALKQAGIKQVNGNVISYTNNFESQTIPGGWIWDDIGNYYGAGVASLNWRENQYDLVLKSGNKEGDPVQIVSTIPALYEVKLTNELTTGKRGTGDNAYIYLPPYAAAGFIRGTIPPGQNAFTISGSFPDPALQLTFTLVNEMQKQGIIVNTTDIQNSKQTLPAVTDILVQPSPDLESINYWFLKKSINLYGEALVKTLGHEKLYDGSTEAGLTIIKNFWKSRGITESAINIIDGSGLSPANRVTPEALVRVMQYAKSRPWFNSFYNALPEINGIKMKSGFISGARSFTGYVGNYTFAIVINNYTGSSGEIAQKMYNILNLLK